jgi:hypothetical protein
MAAPRSSPLGKVNPRFYGLQVAGKVAWLSAIVAVIVALALGERSTGWMLWSFVPLVAPFAVRAKQRGSLRAPGVIALAMVIEATAIASAGQGNLYALIVAPVLLLCFMTTAAIAA